MHLTAHCFCVYVIYQYDFLNHQSSQVIAGYFQSLRSPLAELHAFAALSKQDVDRKLSYKGALAAGGLFLC